MLLSSNLSPFYRCSDIRQWRDFVKLYTMHFFFAQHPDSFLLSSLSILLSNRFSNTTSVSWILPKLRRNCHLRIGRVLLPYHAVWSNVFLPSTMWIATATGSSISLCKLFANKVCVNQDGVPWTNPLVATPNTQHYVSGFKCPHNYNRHNNKASFQFCEIQSSKCFTPTWMSFPSNFTALGDRLFRPVGWTTNVKKI